MEKNSMMNSDLMEREKEKWEREQRHIESQMIGIIENNRKYQDIMRKDEEIKLKLEEQKKKKEKEMKKKIKKNDEKMKEAYIRAKKPLRQMRAKQIKKFRADIKEAKEEWMNHGHKVEAGEGKNHSEEGSNDDDNRPAHIIAQEKVQYQMLKDAQQQHHDYLDVNSKLNAIEKKEEKASKNLADIRSKQHANIGKALSLIEENKQKANLQFERHLDETATNFIRKLIKIREYRNHKDSKVKSDSKKAEKEYKKKCEQIKDLQRNMNREKRERLKAQKERYNKKLEALEQHNESKLKDIDEYTLYNLERIEKARNKYFNIQHVLSLKSDAVCQKLKEETDKIHDNKISEEEKIMNKIKMLHDLAMKKAKLKASFDMFQSSNTGQKKSMAMMEEFGIKSDKLTELFKEIEQEERNKLKKGAKGEGDEEEEGQQN